MIAVTHATAEATIPSKAVFTLALKGPDLAEAAAGPRPHDPRAARFLKSTIPSSSSTFS